MVVRKGIQIMSLLKLNALQEKIEVIKHSSIVVFCLRDNFIFAAGQIIYLYCYTYWYEFPPSTFTDV